MNPGQRDPSKRGWEDALRDAGPYLGLGLSLAVCILLGLGGGYWLDRRLGTGPWLLLLGGVFGMAAAGYQFYKATARRGGGRS
jgi:ATP synthase protein I